MPGWCINAHLSDEARQIFYALVVDSARIQQYKAAAMPKETEEESALR